MAGAHGGVPVVGVPVVVGVGETGVSSVGTRGFSLNRFFILLIEFL